MDDDVAAEMLRKIREMEAGYEELKLEMSSLVVGSGAGVAEPRLLLTGDEAASRAAAKAMDMRYMNIVQSMGQSVHVLDCNYRVIYWGKNSEKLFGYTAREALGGSIIDLAIDEEDRGAARNIISKVYKGESWTGLFPCKNKWGERLLVVATNTPLYDDYGILVGEICMACDSQPFERVVMPSSEQAEGESRFSKLRNKTARKLGIPPQQSLQAAITSRISNLATKVSSKVGNKIRSSRTGEKDRERSLENNINQSSNRLSKTPPCAEDTKFDRVRTFNIPSSSYGIFSELQPDRKPQGDFNQIESRIGSTSSSYITRVDMDPDFADYEISWEHLTIGEQIGQGSCGTVYHAQWYGSDVAVKVFSNQEFSDDLISSFRKELSLMKRLRHPNILLFMGAVTVGHRLCIVTEYLPRGSLFQLLRKKTVNLDWRRRVNMAMDIAQGMNYLHHSNPPIVHRDLKSSNLLVDKNWNVKVGDFGLSQLKLETYLLTKTGKGTPQWMAPESLRHEPSDEKSDVYSYGVILWELATGNVPWEDLNPMQVIGVVGFKNQCLQIPNDMNPHWASIIESCWLSDPRSRPTFLELLQMLRAMRRHVASLSSSKSTAED
ncbi:unnamed protein product [Rhodiola kirilowii]